MKAGLIVAALGLLLAGCTPKDTTHRLESQPTVQEQPAQSLGKVETFHGIGIVKNITPSKTYVVIDHQRIPGFMDAMSMPFQVRDSTILRGIAPEDAIDFEVTVEDGTPYVSSVEKRSK